MEMNKEEVVINPIVYSALVYEGLAAIYYIHIIDNGKILRVAHSRDMVRPSLIRELTLEELPKALQNVYKIIFHTKEDGEIKSELDNTGSVEPKTL